MPQNLSLSWGALAEARAAGVDDMLALHWEEVEGDGSPLDLNWPALRSLERSGVYRTLLLRQDDKLIGYAAFFVQPPLHHQRTVWAVSDVLYVDPDHRGKAGVFMIKRFPAMLKAIGVKVIYMAVKPALPPADLRYRRGRDSVGVLLQKLGYGRFEEAWVKHI